MSGGKVYIFGMMITLGYSKYLQTRYPKIYDGIPSMDAFLWPGMLPILIGKHLGDLHSNKIKHE